MVEVTRIPIIGLIIWFVLYLIIHIGIGAAVNYYKKLNEQKPGNQETEKTYKLLGIAFKWFPAAFVIIIVLVFMN